MVVAVFGTTISPYLFFWQATQEVEDAKCDPDSEPLARDPTRGKEALRRINVDTLVGMALSNLVALAILITAAAALNGSGRVHIETAAQAAEALRPIAGDFAFEIFAAGILGTGLLSIPVLATSAAYALGEARDWKVGLSNPFARARPFYATIALATGVAAVASVFSGPAMQTLVWAAVVNGVVAVPVMVMLMLLSMKATVMGEFRVGGLLGVLGWAGTACMMVAALALLVSFLV
jgi:Mn2+/Fe2+ NRAMP family transporter